MGKINIFGLTLAIGIMFGMATAGSASATYCENHSSFKIVAQKYKTLTDCNAMTPEEANGEYILLLEWLKKGESITTPAAVISEGTLTLTDTTNGTTVECSIQGIGTVGPGGVDEVTEVLSLSGTLPIACTLVKSGSVHCEEPSHTEWLNLPWKTEIVPAEGGWRDQIAKHVGGENPGWKTECLIAKIFKIAQECTAPAATMAVENLESVVDATFDAKTEEFTCTNGDKATVTGTILIESVGNSLALS